MNLPNSFIARTELSSTLKPITPWSDSWNYSMATILLYGYLEGFMIMSPCQDARSHVVPTEKIYNLGNKYSIAISPVVPRN